MTWRSLLELAAITAATTVAATVLHELGHWLTGAALGYKPVLHAGSVSGVPELEDLATTPGWHVGAIALAGPAVTIALAAIAVATLRRRPSSRWALALAWVAPVRMATNFAYALHVIIVAVSGLKAESRPNFDEYVGAVALGIPPGVVCIVVSVAVLALWGWLLFRQMARAGRWLRLLAIVIGFAVGQFGWLALLGPALLG
ncbi:hypothetical protein [Glacieibacterium frigidum]|uniref:Uncharacterized protein n=1 Tax=Glacieibacterium frigidum TaxID=2593303 RepID=A0A552UGR0_9SPHN|nr:hypothetical protein [Glacieibacterium frigidum]TRW17399.1 hypothetical protein FMM06_04310 [Glacieibacterium frigidum]